MAYSQSEKNIINAVLNHITSNLSKNIIILPSVAVYWGFDATCSWLYEQITDAFRSIFDSSPYELDDLEVDIVADTVEQVYQVNIKLSIVLETYSIPLKLDTLPVKTISQNRIIRPVTALCKDLVWNPQYVSEFANEADIRGLVKELDVTILSYSEINQLSGTDLQVNDTKLNRDDCDNMLDVIKHLMSSELFGEALAANLLNKLLQRKHFSSFFCEIDPETGEEIISDLAETIYSWTSIT